MAPAASSTSPRRKEDGERKKKGNNRNKTSEEDDLGAPPQDEGKKKKKRNSQRLHQKPHHGGFDEKAGESRNHKRKPRCDGAAAEADGFAQNKKKDKRKAKRRQLERQQDQAEEAEEEERKSKKQKLRQKDLPDENQKKKKKTKWAREGDGEGGGESDGERRDLITDPRFAAAHSDPRFQRLPRRESKVTIDDRFGRMFSEKGFAPSSAPVDKRGKRRKEKAQNPLLHYYFREEEKEAPAVEGSGGEEGNGASGSGEEAEMSILEEGDSDGSEVDSDVSSSTEEDDDDEEGDEHADNSDAYQFWMANEEDTLTIESETRRLAVVNMDWDHIKAVDLYVLMSTCLLTSCPQNGGQILSVAVYPSEFGLKRMEIEAARGPHSLFDDEKDDVSDGDGNDTDDEIVNEKIRSYQLKRLKYYYAVVECDSSATANHLYNSVDGVEFLRTANVIDLRFIPDYMEFKHPPRDIATEAPPDYKQPDFETFALQHSTVKLTWDDDEPDRKKILRQKFNPEEMDELEQYLASDNSDDDDGEKDEGHGEKYNALLQSAGDSGTDENSDSDKEMEVTFLPGVENLSKHIDKNKLKKEEEGVWDAYLRKRREKLKARKKNGKFSSDDEGSHSEYDESPHQPDDFFVEEPLDSDTKDDRKGSEKGSLKAANKNGQKDRRHPQEKGREEETREASRAELELLLADDDVMNEHLKGFNLRPKKVKGKKGKEVPVEDKLPNVDASNDPRFSTRLTNHMYALDPTDPQYKRSATGMRQAHAQKQRKGNMRAVAAKEEERIDHPPGDDKPSKEEHDIMSLVRSLKLKSRGLGNSGRDEADD